MIGMRGDLDGPAAAAEPVRGLAAFGSQGSISNNSPSAAAPSDSNRYYYHHHHGGVGPAGSSRLSPRDQAPHHQHPHAGGGAAAGGESNGAGRGGIAGENPGSSSERRTSSSSSAQRSGARSNSPYRGGGGANRGPGASSPGGRKRSLFKKAFLVMERDRKAGSKKQKKSRMCVCILPNLSFGGLSFFLLVSASNRMQPNGTHTQTLEHKNQHELVARNQRKLSTKSANRACLSCFFVRIM